MYEYEEAEKLVRAAHAGQVDKNGIDYIEHPLAVADALAPLGSHARISGVLHDVPEDTSWTLDGLRREGVPERAVRAVGFVTRDKSTGLTYQEWVRGIADVTRYKQSDLLTATELASIGLSATKPVPLAVVLKLIDNLHNSQVSRQTAEHLTGMSTRYARARRSLERPLPAALVTWAHSRFGEILT